MADRKGRIVVGDLTGGRNGIDAQWDLAANEAADLVNVDFWRTNFARKRDGMSVATAAFNGGGGPFTGIISFLFTVLASNNASASQLLAVDDAGVSGILQGVNAPFYVAPAAIKDALSASAWKMTGAMANSLAFLTYASAVDRLHLLDSTGIRRAGLAAPVAPTGANVGVAPSLESAVDVSNASGVTSLTWAHTNVAAMLLVVGVVGDLGTNAITGVTYNGVAMTLVSKVIGGTGGTTRDVYLFHLESPATGTHNVVVSASGSIYIGGVSALYTTISTTSQPNAKNQAFSGSAASLTQFVSSTASAAWVLGAAKCDGSTSALTGGAGTTVRISQLSGVAPTGFSLFDSNAVVPAGSTSLVANTAVNGAWSGIIGAFSAPSVDAVQRYYRVRWTKQASSITIGRSEPGASLSFLPSGTSSAVRIMQPAVINEGETHWEVEASVDNVTFYRIATVPVATTTYDDSALSSSYNTNPLSALTGVYTLQKSYRYVAGDQNRVLGLSSYTSTDKQNRLEISAVVGSLDVNDAERVDTTINYFLDFDEADSGKSTGLAGPVDGFYFVFKETQTWKLTATGTTTQPYRADALSKVIGAVEHYAVTTGLDRTGAPALYWMSYQGVYQWTMANGMVYIGHGIEDLILGPTATLRNDPDNMNVVARLIYVKAKNQLRAWWTTGAIASDPTMGATYDVKKGAWTRIPIGDKMAAVRCVTMFPATVAAIMGRDLKPWVGLTTAAAQVGQTDTGTDDGGTAFKAFITTKAYEPGEPGHFGECGDVTLLAHAAAGVTISDTISQDFGAVAKPAESASIAAVGSETIVSRRIENTGISGGNFYQHTIGDAAAVSNAWTLDRLIIPTAPRGQDAS